jgi:uncharacterized protein
MTLKRIFLSILTTIAIGLVGLSLLASWNKPQIQSRLELYQTNLLLHASEWKGENNSSSNLTSARNSIVGTNPLETALTQYQEAQKSAKTTLKQQRKELDNPNIKAPQRQELEASINQLETLIAELDVRVGVLQVNNGKIPVAIETWHNLIEQDDDSKALEASQQTAEVLTGIWSNPAQLLPDAESRISKNLDGWFRYRTLAQLYQLQQRSKELVSLRSAEQITAEKALEKLVIVIGIPGIGLCIGAVLLVGLTVQWLLQRQRLDRADDAIDSGGPVLARNANLIWNVPWDGEIIWQVLVVGFFFVGQILIPLFLPLCLAVLKLNPASFDPRSKAFYILTTYLLLSAGGLSVLYFSIRSFLPLPEGWFRINWEGNWFLWGFGGYFAALPLVVLVSLINQQFWQGQGGSNPILPIVLEGRDRVALAVFFGTAAIAAPVFEEIVFRGFLLPSLTRYLPVWGAIGTSALLFAVAHLNVSEVLPLATLGTVLGFVYTRSRNLLAPMLLHSLWNSGTLLSLFLLGSGAG